MIQNTYGEEIMELNFMNKDMKDNTDKAKEMIIYQTDDSSINTVDVYHYIQSQVQVINTQKRLLDSLDKSAKLVERIEEMLRQDEFAHGNGQY